MAKVEAVAAPLFIHSERDEVIARINPDSSWSVKWDEVLDQAYAPPIPDTLAINSVCRLLMAGRYNFITTPWAAWVPWPFGCKDVVKQPIDERFAPFSLSGVRQIMGAVHNDGVWSVDWDEVQYTFDTTKLDNNTVPILGFCRVLLAAKDNFITKPFPESRTK